MMEQPKLIVGTSDMPLDQSDLKKAPMFSILRGTAVSPELEPYQWDLFVNSVGHCADEEVLDNAYRLGLNVACGHGFCYEGPLSLDVIEDNVDCKKFDAWHAVLEYLNWGGIVAKLPDAMDSPHYRFYAVIFYRHGFPEFVLTKNGVDDCVCDCIQDVEEPCECCGEVVT